MNKNSNQITGVTLYQSNKQQNKQQACRNEVLTAYQAKAFAECKADRLQAENDYLSGLVEYMTNYVMRATTIEELREAKARYKEFQQKQKMRCQDRAQEQRLIWISEMK
jgi:hypothetical protein